MKTSIIMYHYVRNLSRSRYPALKGLSTSDFIEQIGYVKKHYNVISGDDLLEAVASASVKDLPSRALLLTFDDGYVDHFANVFPILERERLPGCFFPSAKCILEGQVLDVSKIHFVLAAAKNKHAIVEHILLAISEFREQYQLESSEYYWTKLAVPSRFDPKEVVFIKRILQRELPEGLRRLITSGLFEKYVSSDETSFAGELYMTADQLRNMYQSGMYIGSHGYDHYWLNSIPPAAQRREIQLSLRFLRQVGAPTDKWIMCYPYGAYDDSLLALLREANCEIGLTTRIGIADLQQDRLLTLPRLDTNDLPKSSGSELNTWTLQAA